jgi:hypothetical protein
VKHIIAGQTNEDTIEWKLELDGDGEPRLKARKGDDEWYYVFGVTGEEASVFESGCEPLGLKPEVF